MLLAAGRPEKLRHSIAVCSEPAGLPDREAGRTHAGQPFGSLTNMNAASTPPIAIKSERNIHTCNRIALYAGVITAQLHC